MNKSENFKIKIKQQFEVVLLIVLIYQFITSDLQSFIYFQF